MFDTSDVFGFVQNESALLLLFRILDIILTTALGLVGVLDVAESA